jgi:cytochrome P450
LLTGSATRDERAFEDPDHFDITRPPSLALGFGYGVHSCLGAALARMESRIAISEMARRWPRYDIVEGGLHRVTMSNVAGYSHVPVVAHR